VAYIEKKIINGTAYYYLTETRRVGSKFKKTRKYLGKTIPKKFATQKKKQKKVIRTLLTKKELQGLEKIRKNYLKQHRIDKTLLEDEKERIVSFIYNTNAIEGNTLTLEETKSILTGKKITLTEEQSDAHSVRSRKVSLPADFAIKLERKERDVKEVENMRECIDFLFDYKEELTEEMILKLHYIEQKNIMSDAGKFRTVNVRVGNYLCPSWPEVPKLMSEFLTWYENAKKVLPPFELAALVHLKFVRIHPFSDGNGRMARLLMNFILLKSKIPLLNIFNDEKILYYLVLQKYDYDKKERPFVKYLFEVFVGQYKNYL